MPPTASGYAGEPNTLAHLDFNNASSYGGSGSTVTDLTGNGYDGTFTNSSFVSGSPSYLNFTGASNSYLQIDHSNSTYTPNGNNVTFMGWFYFNNNTYKTIFSKGLSSRYEVDVNVGFFSPTLYPYRAVFYRASGSSVAVATSTVNQSNSTWVHIAASYDWTDQQVRLYRNGVHIATSSGWGYQAGNAETGGYTRIGQRNDGNHGWSGRVGEFKIFSSALDTAEVLTSYNLNKSTYGH